MKYELFRLEFQTGVHFGEHNLDEYSSGFCADTLFSALFHEALKAGNGMEKQFLTRVKEGKLLFTDAFPCIDDTYYLPKPMLRIELQDRDKTGDSVVKKAYKKLNFIPLDAIDNYIKGNFDAVSEADKMKKLGKTMLKTSAAIKSGEDTEPYHVGIYQFSDQCGLYVIGCFEDDGDKILFYELLRALGCGGIGGKRTAGLGKFMVRDRKELEGDVFERESTRGYLLLSGSLPKEDEIERVAENGRFTVRKRSGFVASSTYADTYRKKKDLYVMQAGGVVKTKFSGDIYDVSDGGTHPVYRYAKPVFWAL